MASLTELRDYVRTQTDTNSAELPNTTIDRYLREAFDRTINAEAQWPFFEKSWIGIQYAGDTFFDMPTDCEELASVIDTDNSAYRLTQIDLKEAEDQYFRVMVSSGAASEFAVWQSTVYLFPRVTFTTDRSYTLRGYRKPSNWLAGPAATTEPDCDERLHLPLCHYAVALAYAQQEDEVLEVTYMTRWQRDVEIARKIIMGPSHHRPLVMGPHRTTRIGHGRHRPSFSIDP